MCYAESLSAQLWSHSLTPTLCQIASYFGRAHCYLASQAGNCAVPEIRRGGEHELCPAAMEVDKVWRVHGPSPSPLVKPASKTLTKLQDGLWTFHDLTQRFAEPESCFLVSQNLGGVKPLGSMYT